MIHFDPSSAISSEYGIFGIPAVEKDCKVILLPVPWEVTTSYGSGASLGPLLIRKCSEQVDLFDIDLKNSYEKGFFMQPYPESLKKLNDLNKEKAQKVIKIKTEKGFELSENDTNDNSVIENLCTEINRACEEMTKWVYNKSREVLSQNKILGVVGGDHSTPFGAIQAVSEFYKGNFGILHIDAHADLRQSYQGFNQSHASIMYNVMNHTTKPKKLVQLGIRDFCEEEFSLIHSRSDIKTFFDSTIKERLYSGETWKAICQDVISHLPENIYVSFDIDGLDPQFCPNTGTPVPGGLTLDQIFYLFKTLINSGRKIISFDLNEVSSGGSEIGLQNEWDGNVGARLLYKLCGWASLT